MGAPQQVIDGQMLEPQAPMGCLPRLHQSHDAITRGNEQQERNGGSPPENRKNFPVRPRIGGRFAHGENRGTRAYEEDGK